MHIRLIKWSYKDNSGTKANKTYISPSKQKYLNFANSNINFIPMFNQRNKHASLLTMSGVEL